MDFQAAMETFAEAWVAANTPTAVNSDPASQSTPTANQSEDPPTMLPKEKLTSLKSSPQGKGGASEGKSDSPAGGAKSLPIHCIVEQVSGVPTFDTTGCQSSTSVELDSYAILPSTTTLCDLVRTALMKLGYSSSDTMNAKGAIQLKNWKPLTFESITNNLQSTVEDILGDLTNVATLKIRICSQPKLSSTDDVKEKLLQLLLNQSQGMLLNSGCPIDKVMLSSISQGHLPSDITSDTRRDFDLWFSEQLKKSTKPLESPSLSKTESSSPQKSCPTKSPVSTATSTPSAVQSSSPHLSATPMSSSGKHTRMRTSFDPEHEIPRLQKWFQVNQHPTREQMILYLSELNSLDSRKGRKQLDLTNIIYWFKNARAAFRRANKSTDDCQGDGEDTLGMAYPDAEESTKDVGGGNMEDRADSPVEESIPYLPNRNAVYVIPNPLHRIVTEEQATDLSTNKHKDERSESPKPSCPSESGGEEDSNLDLSDHRQQASTPKRDLEKVSGKRGVSPQGRKRRHSEESCASEDEENEPRPNSTHKSMVKQEIESDHDLHEVPVEWTGQTVRSAVVELLQEMSQSTLAALSPLSQSVISNISNGKYCNKICPEKCKQFGMWYRNYRSDPAASRLQNLMTKDSRLTFHPKHELPLMRQWYRMCKSPSDEKLEFYVNELNQGHVRKERPKVSLLRLKNWWKNEKQREKREQKEGPKPEKSARHSYDYVRNYVDLDNGAQIRVQNSQFFTISDSQPGYR